MPPQFFVQEHIFEGQHIRGYRGTLPLDPETPVRLHAKSYTPLEVHEGKVQGKVTIIAFHANAFNKEVYEPFFDALYTELKMSAGIIIGSIWIADSAAQGSSALLNAGALGADQHWYDHSRDCIQMVNVFRKHMRRPIMAVGHSMGGTQAVAAAHFHPELFEAAVLIDPPMTMSYAPTLAKMYKFALGRPDTFDSRADIEAFIKGSPLFSSWDKEVITRYIDTGFHTSPTTARPDNSLKPKTTIDAELNGLARPNPEHAGVTAPMTTMQRRDHSELDTDSPLTGPVYNPFTRQAYAWLPTLRPAILFVLGKGSQICPPKELEDRVAITGVRPGGSGGAACGNVASVTVPGGHFLPMTNPKGLAKAAAEWIAQRIHVWQESEEKFLESRINKTEALQQTGASFQDVLKKWDGKPWPNPLSKPDGGRSKL